VEGPLIHKDPFDRLLIAPAQTEGLLMMTDDGKFKGYEISII
jgi:PIN domain nuclease of toxin-antitoxin system